MKNAQHLCELLSPIDPEEAMDLVRDDRYAMQVKEDGFRLLVDSTGGGRYGFDRQNQITAIPRQVFPQLEGLLPDTRIDGELVDGTYVAWDILRWMDEDVRGLPYHERLELLEQQDVNLVPTWHGESRKAAELVRLHDAGAEGVCFKDLLAVWQPGRAQQHFKLKFWESATCRVADKTLREDARPEKHSIALELLDGMSWMPMGFVTIPNATALPPIGALVEVRYLYAQTDGLYQPVFLGARPDIEEAACSLAQLKWKRTRGSYVSGPGAALSC